jgi:hypothetical protein
MQSLILKRSMKEWNPSTDRLLGDALLDSEWSALFEAALRSPPIEPLRIGEERLAWEQRQEKRFRDALPRYPLLARIWQVYVDAFYANQEMLALRAECLNVERDTSNLVALRALQKLLSACDEAIAKGVGLYLACD